MKLKAKDLIKKLVGNRFVDIDDNVTIRDAITVTATLTRYITSSQIGMLLEGYSDGTIRRYITELVSSNHLQTLKDKRPGEEAIYTITRKGIDYTKFLLGENIANLDLSICDTVPELIREKTHRIYANELYFYICATLNKSFSFIPEAALDCDGAILFSAEDRLRKKIIVDDCFEICLFDSDGLPYTYTIYGEQDMNTQQGPAITNKLQQYMDYADLSESSEICFSINALSKEKKRKASKGARRDVIPETALIVMQTLLSVCGDCTLEEFREFFYNCHLKEYLGSRRYTLTEREVKRLEPSDELMSDLLSISSPNKEPVTDKSIWYIRRRNFIRSCIVNMPSVTGRIKEGLKIRFVDNHNLDCTFRFSHPELLGSSPYGVDGEFTTNTIDDIVFTTCIGNTIYENVSDDISGYVRMKALYEKGIPNGYNVRLFGATEKDMLHFVEHTKGLKERLVTTAYAVYEGYPIFVKYPELTLFVPLIDAQGDIYICNYLGNDL